MTDSIRRRELLKSGLATVAGLGAASAVGLPYPTGLHAAQADRAPMPTRRLGRTNYQVGLFSLGGQSTVEQQGRRKDAVEIINRALDLGVNYIDTAARYGRLRDGQGPRLGISEGHIGEVMKDRRKEVFLASKSHDYTYDGTMKLCEQSLKRLQTDHLDLYQHHAVHTDEKLSQTQAKDGAVRAFERLHREGVIRYKGITGHSSRVLLRALEQYDYDCVLVTLNAANSWMLEREYLGKLLSTAAEKDVGVIAMKVVARGDVLDKGLTMEEALTYTLSFPVATAIIGISVVKQVDHNAQIARDFEPFNQDRIAELERRAAS
ncbi:MAG: aldo/keto reductase [Planctomycetota bacterium]